MRESRSERIIARQRQCGTCEFEGAAYCRKKKQRFSDMDIWEDCQDYNKRERRDHEQRVQEFGNKGNLSNEDNAQGTKKVQHSG